MKGSTPAKTWWLQRYEAFLIPLLVLFLLGNAFGYLLPGNPLWQPLKITGPLLLMLAGVIVYSRERWVIRASLWLIAFLLGGLYFSLFHFQPGPRDVLHKAPVDRAVVEGIVTDTMKQGPVLAIRTVNGHPAEGRALLYHLNPEQKQALLPGDTVRLAADIRPPFENRVPGSFNQKQYLLQHHVTAVLKHPDGLTFIEKPKPWRFMLLHQVNRLKNRVADVFRTALPSPHAEILGGIVLGEKAVPVDRDTKRAFVQTGLIHLLAASGMNVGIIAAFLFGLSGLLQLPFRFRVGLAMAGVAFYALLTGLPPSIQRAATMLELALLLKFMNRQLSSLFLLCLAAACLVVIYPSHIGSIGFQFSVLTTFGLITLVPPLQDWLGRYITRWAAGILLVPLVAQLWIWPLSILYFNDFPVHSVLMNIFALVFVTPLTVLGFVAGLCGIVWPWLGQVISLCCWPLVQGLLWIVHWGNSWHWAQWTLPAPSPGTIALFYAQLALLYIVLKRPPAWPKARIACLLLSPLLAGLIFTAFERAAEKTAIRMAVIPLSATRHAMLLEQGAARWVWTPAPLSYWEGQTLSGYLRHRNIQAIDALILADAPARKPQQDATGLNAVTANRGIRQIVSAGDYQVAQGALQLGPKGLMSHIYCVTGFSASVASQCPLTITGHRLILDPALSTKGVLQMTLRDNRLTLF